MKLLIDDRRTMHVDKIARTFNEGKEELAKKCWNTIYFDHNLGDDFYTGTRLLAWAEHLGYLSPTVIIVTDCEDACREMGYILDAANYKNPSGDTRTWLKGT